MTLCGRRPVLPPVHRKGYQRTQRVTCHGHTIVHDINYLDGSLSIVNDFWVVFPNLLLQAFLRDTPSRKTGRPPGSVSGGGAGGGQVRGGRGYKATVLSRDCRGHQLQGHCCHLLVTCSPSKGFSPVPGKLGARPLLPWDFIWRTKTTIISASYNGFHDETRFYFFLWSVFLPEKKH